MLPKNLLIYQDIFTGVHVYNIMYNVTFAPLKQQDFIYAEKLEKLFLWNTDERTLYLDNSASEAVMWPRDASLALDGLSYSNSGIKSITFPHGATSVPRHCSGLDPGKPNDHTRVSLVPQNLSNSCQLQPCICITTFKRHLTASVFMEAYYASD